MSSLNKVILVGNLGKDPEIRSTPSGTSVTNFSIATTDYRMVDGEKQESTDWHNCVAWGKTADNCGKFLKKGSSVLVEGKLQTRSYDKDGQKKYITEVVAQRVQFLGKKTQEAKDESSVEIPF